jgi:hypothetical protein
MLNALIMDSADRLDVTHRQLDPMRTAQELEQHLNPLLGLHVGKDRQVITERTMQNSINPSISR